MGFLSNKDIWLLFCKFYVFFFSVNLFDSLVYLGISTMSGWYKFSKISWVEQEVLLQYLCASGVQSACLACAFLSPVCGIS